VNSSSPARRRTLAVVATAAAAVLLAAAGCTSSASAEGTEDALPVTYAGARTSFGDSFTYANGLVVEVKRPVTYTPTSQAEGLEGLDGEPVRVRINLINGTSGEFTPNTLGVTIVSGGEEAVQVLDPGARIDLTGPARPLGRSGVAAFDLAFVVQDVDDVELTIIPALTGYEPLVLTTS